jgi:hypothetical protein
MTSSQATLATKVFREFVSAGVRRVEMGSRNPRIRGLPNHGAVDVSSSLPGRGNANGMAYRAMRDHTKALESGWTGLAHNREDIGWVVAMRLADFTDLMAYIERLEREKD